MKLAKLMISLTLTLLAVVGSVTAQTGAVRVAIPFDFTMGGQILQAGTYNVAVNGSVLQVRRLDGLGFSTAFTSLTGGARNQDLPLRLIFHRYGNRYFLSVAWIGDVEQGHELHPSAAELELARNTKQEQRSILASR